MEFLRDLLTPKRGNLKSTSWRNFVELQHFVKLRDLEASYAVIRLNSLLSRDSPNELWVTAFVILRWDYIQRFFIQTNKYHCLIAIQQVFAQLLIFTDWKTTKTTYPNILKCKFGFRQKFVTSWVNEIWLYIKDYIGS